MRDVGVLIAAVRDGVEQLTWSSETFAYAQAYEADSGRYLGLSAGEHASNVVVDSASLVVTPEVAQRQLAAERQAVTAANSGPEEGAEYAVDGQVAVEEPPPDDRQVRRFYGTVSLDPERVGRDVGQVTENVVAHLQALVGSQGRITLEIDAVVTDGVPDHIERTVTENARTLKFDDFGFEAD